MDEYLYILLSLRTTYWSFEKVYLTFKRKFPTWGLADKAPAKKIGATIKKAGLSNQKAAHIKAALKIIKKDFGKFSLQPLSGYKDGDMEQYLLELPGLGLKAARCIMMYSFDRDVLPVDTHTQRVSKRLGLIREVDNKKAHRLLDKIIPVGQRYVYHVGCVVHGRTICLDKTPRCSDCGLSKICSFAKK
ncbi:MAG: endonuclease III [Chlorobiales bacterium]|nr:endonuclease III [Chlorobiales bacterium]